MASTLFRLVYNSSCYVVRSLQAAILPSSRQSALTASDTSDHPNNRKHSNAYRPKLILDGSKLPKRPIDVANEEMERWMLDYQLLKQYLQENPNRTIDDMPSSGLLKRWWKNQEREYYTLTLEQVRLLREIAAMGNDQGDEEHNDNVAKDQSNVQDVLKDALEGPPETPTTQGPATRLRSRPGPNNVVTIIKQEYCDNDAVSIGSGSFHSAIAESFSPSSLQPHEYTRRRHTLPAKRACPTPRVTPYHIQQRQQQQQQQLEPRWGELQVDQQVLATMEVPQPEPVQSNFAIPNRQLFSHSSDPVPTVTTTAVSPRNHTPEQPPRKKQRTSTQKRSHQVSPSPLAGMEIQFSYDREEDDFNEYDTFHQTGYNDYDHDDDGDKNEMDHDAHGDYVDDNDVNDDDESEYNNIFADLSRCYKKTRIISNGMKDFDAREVARPSPPSRARKSSPKGATRTPKTPKRRAPTKAKPRPVQGRVIPSHRPNASAQERSKKSTSKSRKSSSTTPAASSKAIPVPLPSAVEKFSGKPTKRLNHKTKFQVQFRGENHWVWATIEDMDEPARKIARSLLEKERQESRPSLRPQRHTEQRPGSFLQAEDSAMESPMRQHYVRSPATPRQPLPARAPATTPRFVDRRPHVSPSPRQYPVVSEPPQTTHRYSDYHHVTPIATQRHPSPDRKTQRDPRFDNRASHTTPKTPYYPPHRRPQFC